MKPGSIWNEPKDWMMGLFKKQRVLIADWSIEKGSSLPDDIERIALRAVAHSTEEAIISVNYGGKNHVSCLAEVKAKHDEAL